ncbi:unnamed protein product [Closterium sp. NIES-65]|nr:unnamed protein product [Closterium sp. NIES-65]
MAGRQICLKAGEGMVVGVVDSGIWPEHPSFTDAAFPPRAPLAGRATCYLLMRRLFPIYPLLCSAAAGNRDVAMAGGRASGMAPAARMAVYKVLWYAEGSFFGVQADVEAAVNQAVADGVDVISLSLGGMDATDTYFHHMPYLAASLAGVLVAFAAGNGDAPGYDPSGYRMIENFYPFYLTVGASTIGRGGITLKAAALAGAARSNTSSVSTTPAATAYPSVADFSSTRTPQGPFH